MSCLIRRQYTYETMDTFAIFKNSTKPKKNYAVFGGASTFQKQRSWLNINS